MKAFFEEYGFVLVSVAVIAMLITIVTGSGGISDSIKTGLQTTVSGMTEKLTKEFPVTPTQG